MTGYEPLQIDLVDSGLTAAQIDRVTVGGIVAYHPTALGDELLEVTVQGAPVSGPAAIVLEWEGGAVELAQAYEYEPLVDDALSHVMAFGASLTQGVSDATPTFESVQYSPALQAARSLGAFMPQPVLVPDLFANMEASTVGPPPECRAAGAGDFIRDGITDVLVDLAWPEGGGFGYELGRVDPTAPVRNIAAGNFKLNNVINGASISDFVETFLGHLSFDPFGEFGSELDVTQLELIEEAQPTLVFTFDSYGNDGLGPAAGFGNQTELEEIRGLLAEMVDRLAVAADHSFIANLPSPSLLPNRRNDDNTVLDATVVTYNEALAAEAARHQNVYVIPFYERVEEIRETGLLAGDEQLTVRIFGGLLSFDGLHFSPTGYALAADLLVESINAELGLELPRIDIAAVAAIDHHVPSALRAAGVDVDACWVD